MTDPIADMLTRMRNALAVKKTEVVLPMSKIKLGIGKILEKEGWIEKAEEIKNKNSRFSELRIVLKYKKGKPAISFLRRVSKPSLRIYVKQKRMPKVLNNFGIAIISTPKGLMTNKEAKSKKIGGEIICEIY